MAAGHPELLALTALIVLGAGVMSLRALLRADRPRAGRWTIVMLLLLAAYGGALVIVSATSRPVTLSPGQAKYFCGFYIDCHIGVAVVDDRTDTVDTSGEVVRHVVTVEMRSDARRATIGVTGVRAELVAADGRRFQPEDPAAGSALEERLPAGASYRRDLVFEVPADTGPLTLDVSEGWWVDRLIEQVIIGDEDSLLHPRTTLALGAAA